MSRKSIKTIWVLFALILALIFGAGWLVFNRYSDFQLQLSHENLSNEMDFVANLIEERLQKHDYHDVRTLINELGVRSSDASEIVLTAKNGFVLGEYRSPVKPRHVIKKETVVHYSYDGRANLRFVKNLDGLFEHKQSFLYELVAGFLVIGVILFFMTCSLIYIQNQKTKLMVENAQRKEAEKNLSKTLNVVQDREKNLSVTLNSIGDAVITTDAEGIIEQMNPVAEEMTGWSLGEAKGLQLRDVFVIVDASTREQIASPVDKVISTGQMVHLSNHVLLISRLGSEYHISDSAAPIRMENGEVMGVVQVFNDVSDRIKAEEKVRTLSQAVEQSPVSVMITDNQANIEYVNSAYTDSTGYTLEEVVGQIPGILKSGEMPEKVYQDLWRTINAGNSWKGEILNRKKNGQLFWEYAHIAPVFDSDNSISHYLAVIEDITLRKQQEEQILHQAHFDSLTDLPNRFLSLDRLSQMINEAKRNNELVAVLFLDLDDFKKINDTLGHNIGDKLLVEAAERLRQEVRSTDTVARLGGDEFIILVGGLSEASDAVPVVENLLERFRDSFKVDGRELILTASIGIAIYPDDALLPVDLLSNADSAMYFSKEEGRNTYSFFTATMNQNVTRRLALEEQMHGALERSEFQVYYQPKVNILTREIIGLEALLRWFNPALGEVQPDEFIPIAEQTGLIVPIGEFVLNEALDAIVSWAKAYDSSLTVAVNLSPRQFRDPNLVTSIETAIRRADVPGNMLELEITEGVLMGGHGYIEEALQNIHKLGISIALDDFGTGYSSLSYLRRYPFDALKIDRSFIRDMLNDKADQELVNAAIMMAHSLSLEVVAEGVENEGQLALLLEQGCEAAQGYLFSKPLSSGEMTERLESEVMQ